MITKLRWASVLGTALVAVFVVLTEAPALDAPARSVALRSTFAPIPAAPPSTTRPPVKLTNPYPFNACDDIPDEVMEGLGLMYTPPKPVEGVRCEYDAGNYQLAIEPIIWRSYDESLPADALEMEINGHRAAWFWVMKPTEWNNRWWVSCMVMFKTDYGVIQQSLYYSPVYSNPKVDCPSENITRAHQLSEHYIYQDSPVDPPIDYLAPKS